MLEIRRGREPGSDAAEALQLKIHDWYRAEKITVEECLGIGGVHYLQMALSVFSSEQRCWRSAWAEEVPQ
jgi:hypothetical protein